MLNLSAFNHNHHASRVKMVAKFIRRGIRVLTGAVGEINAAQKKFLQTILANIGRMTDLVNDLGDTARIDSGRQQVTIQAISPFKAIEEIIESLLPQLKDKQITIHNDFPPEIPDVQVDPGKFRQILSNLIGNAAKYSLFGGNVTVSGQKLTDEIQFIIRDEGIGMKDDQQSEIFQRYYRTEDVHARDIPGTGLGLYITKRLLEMQGGKIWFESKYNEGTTFYFTLKIAK